MSDTTNDKHVARKETYDVENKGNLASGQGVIDLIPDKTPGREISIRPRLPFREVVTDTRNSFSKSTPSSQGSVRLEDSEKATTVRSVYEIGRSHTERLSPELGRSGVSPPVNYQPPMWTSNHVPPPAPYYHTPPAGGLQAPYGYYVPAPPPQPVVPEIPDYDMMPEDQQHEARIIFRSKFATLRDNYPERSFDDYDEELPLRVIHKLYDDHIKRISIESNASVTKIIMVMIFLGIELFGIRVLGVDLKGYTRNQLAAMKRYDRLLLELGEKYAGNTGNWPIEFRLIFLALVNAAIIIGVKFACDKLGYRDADGFIKMVNDMIGGSVDNMVETKPPPQVDPVTKTAEPPKTGSRDLMGSVRNLMAMAGDALGHNTSNGDIADTIGNIGSDIIANSGKDKKKSRRGVRFGNRDAN